MENKVIKRSFAIGGIALSLSSAFFSSILAIKDANHSDKQHSIKADQVAPSTTSVEIHKTMYDKKDAEFFKQEANKIKNDGTKKESTFSDKLFHYNPETMGKIEFTLYDITDAVNKHYTDGKGLTGWTTSQSKEAQGRVEEITQDLEKNGDKSQYITGATKVGTKAINNLGNVRFDNVKAYDATKPQKYHYYAAVETKTPKGFVVAKARPLVFVNPFTNPDGTGYLDTTYLYPKNNTQKLEFNLTKYAIYNEADGKYSADGAKELAGAKFQLYRGQPGSGTKVGDVLTTDKNGKVTANNLIMGDYYFVEVPSDVANDSPDNQGKLAVSTIARNDKRNKLTFSIGEDGIEPTKLQGSLVDYGTPTITKKLTNGVGSHQSLHIGDLANFESKVTVPQNIMGSNYQIDATGTKSKSEPYHVFYTRDEPQVHLKDVDSQRHLKITTQDGKTTLKEGTDYRVIVGKNKWWVHYTIQGISAADKAKIDQAAAAKDNNAIQAALQAQTTGQVSDTVAKQTGKKLIYNYNQVVMTDSPMDTNIVNDIYLDWNDGSGPRELKESDHTITYGVHFVKESSGFMGSGIGAQKLQGAQFVVQDERTGKWFNGWKDAKSTETGEKQAQWVDNYQDVKAGILTSDKDGKFALQGFTEGSYKLREIKAPAGYQLMEETQSFKIGPSTDAETLRNPIVVKNNEKTSMPLTGSQRLLVEVVAGTVIVTLTAGTGYYLYQKKRV